MENGSCHYGNQCVEAHGNDELHEWQERFEYRKMRMQRACEKELFGKSFTEQLLEKWVRVVVVVIHQNETINTELTESQKMNERIVCQPFAIVHWI